jgi:hypothetical protein
MIVLLNKAKPVLLETIGKHWILATVVELEGLKGHFAAEADSRKRTIVSKMIIQSYPTLRPVLLPSKGLASIAASLPFAP